MRADEAKQERRGREEGTASGEGACEAKCVALQGSRVERGSQTP